jgi:hypothetical protein
MATARSRWRLITLQLALFLAVGSAVAAGKPPVPKAISVSLNIIFFSVFSIRLSHVSSDLTGHGSIATPAAGPEGRDREGARVPGGGTQGVRVRRARRAGGAGGGVRVRH